MIKRDEEVVYCGYFKKHWGHFLVDCTNRLWFFMKNTKKVDKYIFFIEEDTSVEIIGAYKEFFELLGIWDKVEFVNKPTQFKSIVVPQSSFCRQEKKWSIQNYLRVFDVIARSAVKNINVNKRKEISGMNIFLTRSSLDKAKQTELGLDMLDSFFRNNGYKVLAPETLSLTEQIVYLQEAKTVACCSGTLPHNMLFAHNGARLEIVERNALNNDTQPYISKMRELEVVHIDGNFSIYPVELAYGPFIYGFSKSLKQFAKDMNYCLPDKRYQEKKYYRQLFKNYIKKYKMEHYLCWHMGGRDSLDDKKFRYPI